MITQATPADVALLRTPEIIELFCTLEAPAIAEMHGEYPATLLQLPNLPTTVAWHLLLDGPEGTTVATRANHAAASGRASAKFRQ